MTANHQVSSFHYASITDKISFQKVNYIFLKTSFHEEILLEHLIASVRSLNPDVIILHGMHSIFKAIRFTGVMKDFRIFIQHHGEKVFNFPKSIIQKRVDRNVIGYFFSSKEMGIGWIRAGLIQNSKKILEVLEVTSSFTVETSQVIRSEKRNFIWVGRLDANKDPLTLVEGFIAFLKVQPTASLYLIFSTNDLLEAIKKEVKGFQTNIHLVGEVPHREMPKWYAKSDFIISTSLFEAGGVSVLEGMSCGCIPILSDIPSFKRILSNEKIGFLFPKGSSVMLTAALLQAVELNIMEQRKKMLNYFEGHLSATAIASQIIEFTSPDIQKEKSSA
jgi:glycosyltransferase involved in cell wall biosynthesis